MKIFLNFIDNKNIYISPSLLFNKMTIVSIDKKIIEDLVQYKLSNIGKHIQDILNRWNEISADIFIEKARKGIYEEAENDAIELRQLLLEEEKLHKLLDDL